MSRKILVLLVTLIQLLAVACTSAAEAKPIAVYPKVTAIAQYPSQVVIVYRAYMELKVSDVDYATERATRLAYDYGGYLAGSQSWEVDGRKVTSVELAVPNANFEGLRRSLYGLGDLVSESVSGEPVDTYYNDYPAQFSSITVQLRPGGISLPPVETGGWNPMRTLRSAFSVFVSIFGFLADVLIWVVVIGGPFLLMTLGVRVLLKRFRHSS